METTALVIDPNPAVRAITSAALFPIGIAVQSHVENRDILEEIEVLRPNFVLCADDIRAADAFNLCRQIKQDKKLADTAFVLLIASDARKDVEDRAKKAGIDVTLRKPFKSEQLRTLIETLRQESSSTQKPERPDGPVALLIKDTLSRKIIERMLNKRQGAFRQFDSVDSLKQAAKKSTFSAVLTDQDDHKDISWHDSAIMGLLILITSNDSSEEHDPFPEETRTLSRPLSVDTLNTVLNDLMALPQEEDLKDSTPLDKGEQALLSARISAAVYQLLLNQDALRQRKWEEACSLIGAEALRICRRYSG